MPDDTPAGEPIDLAGILEAGPPKRTAVLDLERLDFQALGVGELLELSRAAGVAPGELGRVMRSNDPVARGRLAVALAWTIARRAEPELALRDVERWAIEVRGKPTAANPRAVSATDPTPAAPNRAARRSSSRKRGPSGSSGSPGR